jgi:guanyl-specific ribonuclease Sa
MAKEKRQMELSFKYEPATGIGEEKGVCRRDPSDIVKVGDTHYVWYTKVLAERDGKLTPLYPSGYFGTIWYATSTDNGMTWTEKSECVPKGKADAFDSYATFTPNILAWKGKYYLYYTAVTNGFENRGYRDIERTAIGVAVSGSPDGPWVKVSDKPVLETTRDPKKFDSFRVDDTCFIIRNNKIWMYYKGRQWERTPRETRMGVAVAEKPTGPFKRMNDGNHVQDSGHEVMVWPYKGGVMSMVSNTGPNAMTVQYAKDGVSFKIVGTLPKKYPKAPGCFRPDLTDPKEDGITWGISMATYRGHPYLERYSVIVKDGR